MKTLPLNARPLPRLPLFQRACLAVLCLAILLARLSGAHLHLCFDGSEPAQSMQLSGIVSDQTDDGLRKPRHDLDVSLTGEALGKKLDKSFEVPALLAAVLVMFVALQVCQRLTQRERAAPAHPIPLVRPPPSRGPPR